MKTPQKRVPKVDVTLGLDGRTVLDGHMRLSVLRELGYTAVEIRGKVYDITGWPSPTMSQLNPSPYHYGKAADPFNDLYLRFSAAAQMSALSLVEFSRVTLHFMRGYRPRPSKGWRRHVRKAKQEGRRP